MEVPCSDIVDKCSDEEFSEVKSSPMRTSGWYGGSVASVSFGEGELTKESLDPDVLWWCDELDSMTETELDEVGVFNGDSSRSGANDVDATGFGELFTNSAGFSGCVLLVLSRSELEQNVPVAREGFRLFNNLRSTGGTEHL